MAEERRICACIGHDLGNPSDEPGWSRELANRFLDLPDRVRQEVRVPIPSFSVPAAPRFVHLRHGRKTLEMWVRPSTTRKFLLERGALRNLIRVNDRERMRQVTARGIVQHASKSGGAESCEVVPPFSPIRESQRGTANAVRRPRTLDRRPGAVGVIGWKIGGLVVLLSGVEGIP